MLSQSEPMRELTLLKGKPKTNKNTYNFFSLRSFQSKDNDDQTSTRTYCNRNSVWLLGVCR